MGDSLSYLDNLLSIGYTYLMLYSVMIIISFLGSQFHFLSDYFFYFNFGCSFLMLSAQWNVARGANV